MFHNVMTAIKLWKLPEIGQIPVTSDVFTPEQASLVFSGPKFLVALVAGVLMAFAFQLLLTNFSVAVGISALGGSSGSDESELNCLMIHKQDLRLCAIASLQ